MIDKARKVIVAIYVVFLVIAILSIADHDFRLMRYGSPEDAFPWIFMLLSSAVSIYFIGYKFDGGKDRKDKEDSLILLWWKRKRLEEKKRISELSNDK